MEGSASKGMGDKVKVGKEEVAKSGIDYGLFTGNDLPSQDVCYQALLSGDPHLDGLLFVGVSSTGIYCRVGV